MSFSASEHCQDKGQLQTPKGALGRYECNVAGTNKSKISLKGKTLIIGEAPITLEAANKQNTLVVYEGATDSNFACPINMYLIDLTGTAPRVFAFGIKNACAEYHWASWGKKRSVIAIKENVRFTYSNGKLIPPPADFGDGMPLSRRFPEDGKLKPLSPFVEEIPVK